MLKDKMQDRILILIIIAIKLIITYSIAAQIIKDKMKMIYSIKTKAVIINSNNNNNHKITLIIYLQQMIQIISNLTIYFLQMELEIIITNNKILHIIFFKAIILINKITICLLITTIKTNKTTIFLLNKMVVTNNKTKIYLHKTITINPI